jgi:hypothetical protein
MLDMPSSPDPGGWHVTGAGETDSTVMGLNGLGTDLVQAGSYQVTISPRR